MGFRSVRGCGQSDLSHGLWRSLPLSGATRKQKAWFGKRVINGGCLASYVRELFILFGTAAFVKSFKCVKILITMQNPDLRCFAVNGV